MALVLGVLVPSQGRAAPTLRMRVSVYPNPMRSDTRAESITVLTQPRIICVAFVLYDNGTIPLTFEHAETEVTSARGVATWGWHETSAASGGTASVSCNNGVTTRTVNAHFRVVPAAAPRPTAHPATRGALTVRVIVTPQPWPHRATRATVVAYTIPVRCALPDSSPSRAGCRRRLWGCRERRSRAHSHGTGIPGWPTAAAPPRSPAASGERSLPPARSTWQARRSGNTRNGQIRGYPVDDPVGSAIAALSVLRAPVRSGKWMVKVLPVPSTLSTAIVPPWRSTISCTT